MDGHSTLSSNCVYPSLEVAQSTFPNHQWIYLDPNGIQYLEEYEHPKDNVVYVVGHDTFGFGNSNLSNGIILKLKTNKVEPFIGHAFPTLLATISNRWSKTWQ